MQKNVPLALVVGALIIGAALVYHAQHLAQLSAQLQATQRQMATLDTNLQNFARELPKVIGEAGRNAGRQAVHGMAEEAIRMPLNWLKSSPFRGASDALLRYLAPAVTGAATTNKPEPLRRFEVPQSARVTIGGLSNVEGSRVGSRLPQEGQNSAIHPTNQAAAQMTHPPGPAESP